MPSDSYTYLTIYCVVVGFAYPVLCRYKSMKIDYREWFLLAFMPVVLPIFGLYAIAKAIILGDHGSSNEQDPAVPSVATEPFRNSSPRYNAQDRHCHHYPS